VVDEFDDVATRYQIRGVMDRICFSQQPRPPNTTINIPVIEDNISPQGAKEYKVKVKVRVF
jgi:hypothetical protein